MRTCKKCGQRKPATREFFDNDKGNLRHVCKDCRRAMSTARRRAAGVPEKKLPIDVEGLRKCTRCDTFKPLDEEHFTKHYRNGVYNGYCRACRYATERKSRNRPLGRATALVTGYRRHDIAAGRECDLTPEWVLDNIIDKPCHYCGSSVKIGADRIDNAIGHTQTNVIPACPLCNRTRSNRFTVEEMKQIGEVIARIRKQRVTELLGK